MAFITRKVVKGPEGRPHISWVNTETGETVPHSEIGNHSIIEQGNGLKDISTWRKKEDGDDKKETDQSKAEQDALFEEIRSQASVNNSDFVGPDALPRTEENNFGFISKPSLVSWLGMVPGPIGTVSKAAGTMVNVNNAAARDAARDFLGMPPLSMSETLKDIAFDNKGYIGDVVIGGEQIPIGLGDKTPEGRQMTDPSSARAFMDAAKESGVETRFATPDEVAKAETESRAATKSELDFSSPADLSKSLGRTVSDAVTGRELQPVSEKPNLVDAFNDARALSPVPVSQVAQSPQTGNAVSGRQITPGAGLANLAPNGLVSTKEMFGPQTLGPPQKDLSRAIELATQNTFGPGYTVNQTSGERNNSGNHRGGRAADFNISDPQGNRVTDPGKLQEFAAELGRQGIQSLGHGQGYMGPGMFHAGMAPSSLGATTWGAGGKSANADPGVRDAFLSELTPGVGILPFENPPVPTQLNDGVPSVASDFVGSAIEQDIVPRDIPQDVLDQMARTIAGELGSNTLAGIRSGDPESTSVARSEIADIANTMVNRSIASGARSWDHVTDGAQYNSMFPANLRTTDNNYRQAGSFINNALNDFNRGTLVGNSPQATHYRAGYVQPGWANREVNRQRTGEHIFSNVLQRDADVQEYQRRTPDVGLIPDSRPDTGLTPSVGDSGGSWGDNGSDWGYGGSDGSYGSGAGATNSSGGGLSASVEVGGFIDPDSGRSFNYDDAGNMVFVDDDSSSGGGDGKVICGYFYEKGKIPLKIYMADLRYAKEKAGRRTREGYLLWAKPFVRWLEKKERPLVEKIIWPFTKGWVYEMAYRMGRHDKRTLWGLVSTSVISSVCYTIGYVKEKL